MSETQVHKVTLTTGEQVEFSARQKVDKRGGVNEDGSVTVDFAFKNGEVRTFRMTADHPLFARAALHGLNQKFGDSFAGIEDIEDMVLAFEDLAKTLTENNWAEKRGGEGVAGTSVLARALMAVTGQSREEIKAFLSPLSAADKMALRQVEPFASKVKEIEAERQKKGTSKVDVSALLAKLGASPA